MWLRDFEFQIFCTVPLRGQVKRLGAHEGGSSAIDSRKRGGVLLDGTSLPEEGKREDRGEAKYFLFRGRLGEFPGLETP